MELKYFPKFSDPKSKTQSNTKPQKKDKSQWKAGMHCRAVYEGDGIEYEALLLRIISNKECVVRFLGKTMIIM